MIICGVLLLFTGRHHHEHDHGDNKDSVNAYYEFLEKRMNGYSYTITDMSKPAYVTFDSVAQADGMMYLYVDTREFTDLTVTINGKTIKLDLFGFKDNTTYELGEVKKGDVAKITIGGHRTGVLENGNVYAIKNGNFTTISYTVDKAKFENAYNTLDAMSDTELLEFEDTYVKAKVTSYTDGALYIPITFDKGWKIFVDGQQVGLYEHQSHILMTDIRQGEHIVEMKYCPVGFVPGAAITGVSVAILVAWAVIATKRSKKEELCVTIDETSVNEE
ncbi:MAG: YfhO family protein [Clostridia bacterium]|nr:YfhO family protein [Clostridia bacterium]